MRKPRSKAMSNYKAQNPNQCQMIKIECAPQYPPLKIRGVRGVMRGEVMEVTPCYPPYSKGELGKRGVVLTFRHSDFVWPLDFVQGSRQAFRIVLYYDEVE
jgi:hypothetical protein